MKHLQTILAILVLFTSFGNEVVAQKQQEEVLNPQFYEYVDPDGKEGLQFQYTGRMNRVSSVVFGTGSCEHSFEIRMKTNPAGNRAIFIPDPNKRLVFGIDDRLYLDGKPILSMSVSFEDIVNLP